MGSCSLIPSLATPSHIMGTKLSKTENKNKTKEDVDQEADPVGDKAATLPAEVKTEDNDDIAVEYEDADVTAKSETLPRSGFDRACSFSKRFRKSMSKMVGRKKTKEAKPEEKVEAEEEPKPEEAVKENSEDDF